MFYAESQLMITLTICRHALQNRSMSRSQPSTQKIPKIFVTTFVTTGHCLTDLIIDATEFKFQCATNYEINLLMFSNYKNTQTGKALIGVSAHGSGIVFSDIYPGSISDSQITEKTFCI